MSKTTFHFVGPIGSRKTTVALGLARMFHCQRPGVKVLLLMLGCPMWFDAAADDFVIDEVHAESKELTALAVKAADVLFIEHEPRDFKGGKPGDLVMHMHVVREGVAEQEGAHLLAGIASDVALIRRVLERTENSGQLVVTAPNF